MAMATLVGCGMTTQQKAAVAKFSTATSELAEVSADHLVAIRNDTIVIRTGMSELGSKKVDVNDPVKDLDAGLDVDDLEARLAALVALKSYADVLQALATTDNSAEIQAAGGELLTNLGKVKGIELKPGQAGAIQSAIGAVGGLYIEYRKEQATKTVVRETSEPITKILGLLRADFDPAGIWAGNLADVENQLEKQLPIENQALGGEGAPADSATASLRSRYAALKLDARARRDNRNVARARLTQILDSFDKAHRDLEDVSAHKTFKEADINNYVAQVQQFVVIYKALAKKD
jgi:hypothetical protein